MNATSKSGLAVTRRGYIAHRISGLTATLKDERLFYDARWVCTPAVYRRDVILLDGAGRRPYLCAHCESVTEGPAVYRCYDADDRLLYIGSTISKHARFLAHERTAPWWNQVARTEVHHYPHITEARIAEMDAIVAEKPAWNAPYRDGRSISDGNGGEAA